MSRRRFNPAYLVETGWLAAGFVSKLLIQMGTLYYLTKSLQVEGSGTFFAITGLLACLVPFVQLGNYDLTVRQIARKEDPQTIAGRAMRSSIAAYFVLLPVLVVLRLLFARDVGWTAFLMVATGELLVLRVMSNVQAVATGFRLHYVVAVSDFLTGLSRFIAIYACAKMSAGIDTVLIAYSFTAIPPAVAAYAWMAHRIGTPKWRGGKLFEDVADHRRMVIAWFAEMATAQGDKPLLMKLATVTDVGIYGTASKLFAVVIVPVDLLTQVFRPRVGAAYADGDAAGQRYARMMTIALVALGAMAGTGLALTAWLLPIVAPGLIPQQFADARVALMYLSAVPAVYGLQRANVISSIARGATGAYATATLLSAVIGLGTLALLAPIYGWRGACLAYGIYVLTSAIATGVLARRHAPTQPAPVEEINEIGLATA